MKLIKNDEALFKAPFVLRRSLGRHRTVDTSIPFRMGAGFPGDVNRGHPASIQPCLISPINPVLGYGVPVVVDTAGGANGGVRPLGAADGALTDIWGVSVRPYPIQQASGSNYGEVGYGTGVPPQVQPLDVIRGGYVMVPVVGQSVKGGAVFVWVAASGGGHIQGGFEIQASGGNTCALDPKFFQFNSPPDSTGIAELILNKF